MVMAVQLQYLKVPLINATIFMDKKFLVQELMHHKYLDLHAQVAGDSVKIFWYAANEMEGTTYSIYRSGVENPEENDWKIAGSLKKNKNTDTNYYEFYDWPDINGSIYYRIAQKNDKSQPQYSGIEKVDYFRNAESISAGTKFSQSIFRFHYNQLFIFLKKRKLHLRFLTAI
ncbi:MAG: hypothetical protein MZV64_00870 [Ignavibacteriales bacterium]|nr:hypothetical protein [Ignavibacteriales bacterium]